jgi:vacuolar-type H+-ATPase subunit D/Vma8
MAELTLQALRGELAPILAQLESMAIRLNAIEAQMVTVGARVEGLPLIGRTVTVIQQEQRTLRAAFNDFAMTNVTAGEITAMHDDINRALEKDRELEARITTLERLIRELQDQQS